MSQLDIELIKSKTRRGGSMALAILIGALIVVSQVLVEVASAADQPSGVVDEESASGGGGGGHSEQSFAPKRQYLIAPRIGRSVGGGGGSPSAIWSALEEAAFLEPGQVQANRGFPNPMRSSMLFLVGNRRLRSPAGGLLPQARIGRRASPSGLLPQPRVGRRSLGGGGGGKGGVSPAVGDGENNNNNNAELELATIGDNSALSEAIESLLG